MADEGFKRKLAAILSADVEGYSRLMDDDEEATVRTLTDYRTAIADLVGKFRGRIVDTPGDNILAEFPSVVDSVNCAAEIQRDLVERNADLPDNRRMAFRIGVNLGDVIEEEGRIYGDGVNIAARIERLADAGGVCVSRNVYDHIKKKMSLGYEFLGEHPVKNISEPVSIYKVLMDEKDAGKLIGVEKKASKRGWIWAAAAAVVVAVVGFAIWQFYMRYPTIEPASVEKMAFPLPDKPSIAVLPFDNMSEDPEQEHFSDGITEDIITALSKADDLLVIARNSSFVYKGKPVKIKQVAEELGVRYVLEGSVRKSEDRVRITAQLIDATKGHHLWAERYERDLKDIFALQDEITMKVVSGLHIKLTGGEESRMLGRQFKSLDARMKFSELMSAWNKGTPEGYLRHGQLAQEIIDMEPESPVGYSSLGWNYWILAMHGKSPRDNLKTAYELAQKALSLDESYPLSYALLNAVYMAMGQYEKAIAAGERGIALMPNGAFNHVMLGMTLNNVGKPDEALNYIKQGIRLDPFPDPWVFYHLGRSYRQKGQYEKALTAYKKALHLSPDSLHNHLSLTVIYVLLDRQEEAEAAAKKILEIEPSFSVKRATKALPYKNKAELQMVADALRKAGLPYTPPLPLPDKPSIAVLAFDNLSGDPEQEYFSDGITEEIISALSKTDQLFVIARNSSFVYKGKPVNVKQIARELGVRYVLEGSVRKSEDRIRITAQLIDATKGHHLWSERYDRDLKDIFAVQDEITMKIITALQVELTEGEQMRIWARRYKTLDVQLKAMELLSLWRKGTLEAAERHYQIAQELIEKEPEHPIGYRNVGWHHWVQASIGKSPKENLKKALEMAQKAISLDESDAASYALLGSVYSKLRQHDKAIATGKHSVELEPNGAQVNLILGQSLTYAGRPDEAMEYLNKAIRLNPFPNYLYPSNLGRCYLVKRQYEKALTEFKKAVQLAPKSPPLHFYLAVTYALLDRTKEARASADKTLELFPNYSVKLVTKTSRWKNQADLNLIVDAMRKAGFPQGT